MKNTQYYAAYKSGQAVKLVTASQKSSSKRRRFLLFGSLFVIALTTLYSGYTARQQAVHQSCVYHAQAN